MSTPTRILDLRTARLRHLAREFRSTARRLGWGVADQAVSSITNFAVGAVIARSLGVVEFGVFALVGTTYGVLLNISRGLSTDPLVVRFSGRPNEVWRAAARASSGTALLIGLATGVISVVGGAIAGGSVGGAYVALGISVPLLLIQDSVRFAFFASGDGRKAFFNDLVWAVALVPTMLVAAQFNTIFAFVVAWGTAAGAGAVFGAFQTRMLPSLRGTPDWLRQQRDLGIRYLLENIAASGGIQLRMSGLGAIVGLASVGAYRGAQLAIGPLIAVLMGFGLVAIPEASRALQHSTRRFTLFCLTLGGGQACATLLWGLGLILVIPDRLGTFVLGSVWAPASGLFVPVVLAVVLGSFSAGASAGLRALGAARFSLRSQLFEATTGLAGTLLGAVLGGLAGACWGIVIAAAFCLAVWWGHLHAALRERASDPERSERTTSPGATREEIGI